MNTRTTLFLSLILLALAGVYFVAQRRAVDGDPALTDLIATGTSSELTRDVIEQKPGDVIKIVYHRPDGDAWVFEKDQDTDGSGVKSWRMTEPLSMKCTTWDVEKYATRLTSLKYEVSHLPGESGAVSAAGAGLEPARARISLTDSEGMTVAVDIGKPASSRETYVRLEGSEAILVAKSDLKDLLRDEPLEFRDKQLWGFTATDVTEVEVVDRSSSDAPVTYRFRKDGTQWLMESPVSARATSAVDDLVRNFSRLRATNWLSDDIDKLAMYGLSPATWTLRVRTEVVVKDEPEDDDTADSPEGDDQEDESKIEPEVRRELYVLHLSDRSPIGEDTSVYVRIGDESAVATIARSTAKIFKPVMDQVREMRITTASVAQATRIEMTHGDGSTTLVKRDAGWWFEPDNGRAEDAAVTGLLAAIADMKAVVFIDEDKIDPLTYGMDKPQVEFRLTLPGQDEPERIIVGAYTHPTTKRMIYVRRNEASSVGKVQADAVAKLLEVPRIYRDRTIVEILPSRFQRLTLSIADTASQGRSSVTFARDETDWTMIEPTHAQLRRDQIDKLLEGLGGLRAERVVAEADEASAYGLHAPKVRITIGYHTAGDVSEDESALQTIELALCEHDGKHYLERAGRPAIYEVSSSFYSELFREYRTDRVMDFSEAGVRSFQIRNGDQLHRFELKDDRWVYGPEPDLPLDSNKVKNLLLQIRDLRTHRYVEHVGDASGSAGLSELAHEVHVEMKDGSKHYLRIGDHEITAGLDRGYASAVEGNPGLFLLTAETVNRIVVSLDTLEP